MAIGPGKYDDLCTLIREQAEAAAAIVIVINGNKGSGFSIQTDSPAIAAAVPDLLETLAREVRDDNRR